MVYGVGKSTDERDTTMTTVHTPCPHCDMDTRDECESWDHMRVDGLIMLRMADAFRGRVVPRWVVDLIADECFADSPAFDRHQFLIRCGVDHA